MMINNEEILIQPRGLNTDPNIIKLPIDFSKIGTYGSIITISVNTSSWSTASLRLNYAGHTPSIATASLTSSSRSYSVSTLDWTNTVYNIV
jgi:hypothetical protein